MGHFDHQFMLGEESTYGTVAAQTRGFRFSGALAITPQRVESEMLRPGQNVARSDAWHPTPPRVAGQFSFDIFTKGFGVLFKHMLGNVVTTGPSADGAYTHTFTMPSAGLLGKSLTVQEGLPLHPSGTVQAITGSGGKVTDWTIGNSVGNTLALALGMDFQKITKNEVLTAASEPSNLDLFTWAGGSVSLGGSAYCVDEIEISCNNNLDVERDKICTSAAGYKAEPTPAGKIEPTFSIGADFDSMAQYDRAVSLTRAGAVATISAAWTGPNVIGGTTYPSVTVSVPVGRWDEWSAEPDTSGGGIKQAFSGVVRSDGTNSPVTIVYVSADSTP